jgi:signal transduction histidine kinase/HAMP domain-containing protein
MKENKKKRPLGVRGKFILIFTAYSLFFSIIFSGLNYFLSKNTLLKSATQSHKHMALLLEQAFIRIMDEEVSDLKLLVSLPEQIAAVESANLKYETLDESSREKFFEYADKKWQESTQKDNFLEEYLGSEASERLYSIANTDKNIVEIFITDKFGGLVASSGKTSDFYQADEKWWQKTFRNGDGKTVISDIEFDKSANILGIPFATPVLSKTGKTVGICKAVLDAERFFSPLDGFKIGKTGHAVLVDGYGRGIFYPRHEFFNAEYSSSQFIKNICDKEFGCFILNRTHGQTSKILSSFVKVRHPLLADAGIAWYIVFDQDLKEILGPREAVAFLKAVAVFFILMAAFLPISFIVIRLYVEPLQKLHIAVGKISKGDLNHTVILSTNDEIQELADLFNSMTADLKRLYEGMESEIARKTSKLSAALKRSEEQKKALEDTKEAMLNIMEDLEKANNTLKQQKSMLEEHKGLLEKSNKELDSFVYTVSHDLRAPLRAIFSFAEFIEEDYKDKLDEQGRDYLREIRKASEQMGRLIEDLLKLSRIKRIKNPYEKAGIISIIQEVITRFKADIKENNVELNVQDDIPDIYCDKIKIKEVFANLINNAIKFSSKANKDIPRVDISYQQDEKFHQFYVKDNGIGIDPKYQQKIFDIFQRLHTSDEYEGTGVGLNIVKTIIEEHKGSIWIESESGKGTCFYFTIPKVI